MPTTACKGTLFASVEAALEFRGPGGVNVKASTEITSGIFAVVDCLRRQPVGSDIALPEFVSEPKTTAPGRAKVKVVPKFPDMCLYCGHQGPVVRRVDLERAVDPADHS